jgi:hypothetical protein
MAWRYCGTLWHGDTAGLYGMEILRDLLVRAVADAPASATPVDAVGAALEAAGSMLQENPERVRLRDAIVSANAELRERELIKLAALASALAGALRDRGIPEPAASLAAETGSRSSKSPSPSGSPSQVSRTCRASSASRWRK